VTERASRQKVRLDALLMERGLAVTRTRAQALIRSGDVTVNGRREDKPGSPFDRTVEIVVRAPLPYVSRGGHKLAAALDAFGVDVAGRVCIDVGASTGGFTDVLLQRGARAVFAVDVGRGQLAWALRQDARVTNLERTDIRTVTGLPTVPDIAVVDVAFISLRRVLPPLAGLVSPKARCVALVKPQFEAGRQQVGRGGVIRDAAVHASVLTDLLGWVSTHDWIVGGAIASPILGASGNREFLALLARPAADVPPVDVASAVAAAVGRGASAPDRADTVASADDEA
jgi:23S rRNA (cytidine1920-2'-O)/16S rRNA (cytidine1409-2'-O)-methyltransferase